jgi:hypothetical protein
MPVPQSWTDLSVVAASNSPAGTEAVGTQMDDYLRAGFAFSKQLHDGWLAKDGTVVWTGNQNANGKTILNVAWPVNASDAAPKNYVDNVVPTWFPRGMVIMWWGQAVNVPAGWLICDGTNGTPDFRDRMPYGAGGSIAVGNYGGANSLTLSVAQMPVHAHSVSDGGHSHGVYDPGHGHGLYDPGHGHSLVNQGSVQAGADNGGAQCPVATGYSSGRGQAGTNPSGTGVQINASGTGIQINGSGSNIGIYNAGGGAAIDIRSAFAAIYFLMKA